MCVGRKMYTCSLELESHDIKVTILKEKSGRCLKIQAECSSLNVSWRVKKINTACLIWQHTCLLRLQVRSRMCRYQTTSPWTSRPSSSSASFTPKSKLLWRWTGSVWLFFLSNAACWCAATCSQGLVSSLTEQSPEEIGDLYLDVGEAYLDQGEYWAALPLLSALVASEKYNLAVVWLRHAGGRRWRHNTIWRAWSTNVKTSALCQLVNV